jgi:hypothetical protein
VRRSGTSPLLLLAPAIAALLTISRVPAFAMQASDPEVVDGGSCPLTPGEYETQGYVVARVEVRGVFDLFQLSPSTSAVLGGIELPVEGAPFRVDRTVAAARGLEERLHQPRAFQGSPFAFTLVISNIEHCSDENGRKQLDVRYRTLTSRLPMVSGRTLESRGAQHTDPAEAAGALPQTTHLRLAPAAAYNASDGLQAGGTVSLRQLGDLVDTVDAQAIGSTRSHLVRLAIAGSDEQHMDWLDNVDWRVSFTDELQAGNPGEQFGRSALTGQLTGQTVPFGSQAAVFRFGAGLEGGRQLAHLEPGTGPIDDRTGYGAFRAAAGVTISGGRYSAAAAYGLLLGHVPGDALVSYRKHVADFAWDSRIPIADHTALQLEARLNAGWLLGADAAPLTERFRGGNRDDSFLEGDTWVIHSSPLLRSAPDNRLDRTAPDTALGGDRFVATNLTLSVPVWRYPLIPSWLSKSKDFKSGIDAAKETGRNATIVYYQSQDPAQKLMADDAARVSALLNTLFDGLSAVQDGVDASRRDAFDDCLDAVDTARDKMARLKETGFGPVATNVVPGVASSCDAGLAAALPPATLASGMDQLSALGASIADKQKLIRTDVAQARADADLKFAFSAMDTFINDVNALAVGPVVTFDAARLGPQQGNEAGGMRYGIGLGVRLSIVNVLHLTALYSRNPSPMPWESRGAWLVSLAFTDLLR